MSYAAKIASRVGDELRDSILHATGFVSDEEMARKKAIQSARAAADKVTFKQQQDAAAAQAAQSQTGAAKTGDADRARIETERQDKIKALLAEMASERAKGAIADKKTLADLEKKLKELTAKAAAGAGGGSSFIGGIIPSIIEKLQDSMAHFHAGGGDLSGESKFGASGTFNASSANLQFGGGGDAAKETAEHAAYIRKKMDEIIAKDFGPAFQ